jgi:hypothetical protein
MLILSSLYAIAHLISGFHCGFLINVWCVFLIYPMSAVCPAYINDSIKWIQTVQFLLCNYFLYCESKFSPQDCSQTPIVYIRFQVIMVVTLKSSVFCSIMLCFHRTTRQYVPGHLNFINTCLWSGDSSVDVERGNKLEGWGSIPAKSKIFLFSITARPVVGAHPASYQLDTGGTLPLVKPDRV